MITNPAKNGKRDVNVIIIIVKNSYIITNLKILNCRLIFDIKKSLCYLLSSKCF